MNEGADKGARRGHGPKPGYSKIQHGTYPKVRDQPVTRRQKKQVNRITGNISQLRLKHFSGAEIEKRMARYIELMKEKHRAENASLKS